MDLTALRKAVGAADTVPDADVISQAVTKLGTIPGLETAKQTAETERDTARTELSRARENKPADKQPDPEVLRERRLRLGRDIDALLDGANNTDFAKKLKAKLLGAQDKPDVLMLSREGDAEDCRAVDLLLLQEPRAYIGRPAA